MVALERGESFLCISAPLKVISPRFVVYEFRLATATDAESATSPQPDGRPACRSHANKAHPLRREPVHPCARAPCTVHPRTVRDLGSVPRRGPSRSRAAANRASATAPTNPRKTKSAPNDIESAGRSATALLSPRRTRRSATISVAYATSFRYCMTIQGLDPSIRALYPTTLACTRLKVNTCIIGTAPFTKAAARTTL